MSFGNWLDMLLAAVGKMIENVPLVVALSGVTVIYMAWTASRNHHNARRAATTTVRVLIGVTGLTLIKWLDNPKLFVDAASLHDVVLLSGFGLALIFGNWLTLPILASTHLTRAKVRRYAGERLKDWGEQLIGASPSAIAPEKPQKLSEMLGAMIEEQKAKAGKADA